MNAYTFTTAFTYLSQMPCGLKQTLFDDNIKILCDNIHFIGRQRPVRNKKSGQLVGELEDITIVDSTTKEYLNISTFYPVQPISEEAVDRQTNIKDLLSDFIPSIALLKMQGFQEVGSASKR